MTGGLLLLMIAGGILLACFVAYRIRVSWLRRSTFDAGTLSNQWLVEQRLGAQKDRFS